MNAAGPELITELVRITARISALIFVAALAAGGADLLAPPSSSFSRSGVSWKLIGAVIVSHTIPFGFVAALAVETRFGIGYRPTNVINGDNCLSTSLDLGSSVMATGGPQVSYRLASSLS
jgi:hypothetical protein